MQRYSPQDYTQAIRALYPQGPYWDSLFQDSQGELSRYVEALAQGVYRLQNKMAQLIEEAYPHRAQELLSRYETLFALDGEGGLTQRRQALINQWLGSRFTPDAWAALANTFGFALTASRPPMFTLGTTGLGSPLWGVPARSWMKLYIMAHNPQAALQGFERQIRSLAPPYYYLQLIYLPGWEQLAQTFGLGVQADHPPSFQLGSSPLGGRLWSDQNQLWLILEIKGKAVKTDDFEAEARALAPAHLHIEFQYKENEL